MPEVPPEVDEALGRVEAGVGFLVGLDPAGLSGAALAEILRRLEGIDSVLAVARGRVLAAFDARDVHLGDGQRTTMAWLTHCLGLTRAYCHWHHHVVLHQLGWTLTVHPDGTSQVTSPDGTKVIRGHSPPPRPG